jgi:hypothetical protein
MQAVPGLTEAERTRASSYCISSRILTLLETRSANDCFIMFLLLQYSAALRSLIGEDRARHTLQVQLL